MKTAMATAEVGIRNRLDWSWFQFHSGGLLVENPAVEPSVLRLQGLDGFRFSTHFHPYVADLVSRLVHPPVNVPTMASLQGADTATKISQGRLWKAQGDSTVVMLPAGTDLLFPEGAVIAQGDLITSLGPAQGATTAVAVKAFLVDGTHVSVAGNDLSVPGSIVPATKSMQFGSGPSATVVAVGDDMNLAAATAVKLAAGAALQLGAMVGILLDPTGALVQGATIGAFGGAMPERELFDGPLFTSQAYTPGPRALRPFPLKELDFGSTGAYSVYNWELFYHAPLTIAMHLSKNQRFEDAQRWFHYIFNPTDTSIGPTPERFWQVSPLQVSDVSQIEAVLLNLATGADPSLQRDTIKCIEEWREQPFRPHVIARWRHSAYKFKAVMAYLDNLIAWGDSLFRQDTRETINEATQIYILAANLLGPRPQPIPRKGSVQPQSYQELKATVGALDPLGNALVPLETDIPFDIVPPPSAAAGSEPDVGAGLGLVTLYFCTPHNDKLMGYWDTLADRLFKIHNSLNIKGVFRQLALFEPPIDPALLARGVAAGLDLGAVLGGMSQPLLPVRFQFLVARATEMCQEVKTLGAGLLAAMEKEDNEALAILRAKHETVILGLSEMVRYAQYQEAVKTREGLEQSLESARVRFTYYERLLGVQQSDAEAAVPNMDPLDPAQLGRLQLRASEPTVGFRDIPIDISSEAGGVTDGQVNSLSSHEVEEMQKLEEGRGNLDTASVFDKIGAIAAVIGDFGTYSSPLGCGITFTFGGRNVATAMQAFSTFYRAAADKLNYEAGKAAKIGSYARREQEWAFQSDLTASEINQMFKQLRAAEIREAVAKREWENHKKQMEQARQIEEFLSNERNGKKTNQALYAWMKREVKGLYADCFQFAFDVAKTAEKAMQHELGDSALQFIQYGYLAGKEGLLAGEKLHFDIKQMEMKYQELNQREYEITKHISLRQVDPMALLRLRAAGNCEFTLPEELFDFDCPGQFFRRIKSVALSMPCVAGPYTGINCKLTLLSNEIRFTSRSDDDGYMRKAEDDDRFRQSFVGVQSVVTSSGQNDPGLFEANLRDERYLPFEGAGAISRWRLELPEDLRQFDYDTIADVILHLRYTSRDGGARLRKEASDNLRDQIAEAGALQPSRLFSLRHDFPSEWAKFKAAWQKLRDDGAGDGPPWPELTFTLGPEHYPYWSQKSLKSVSRAVLVAETASDLTVFDAENADPAAAGGNDRDEFTASPTVGSLRLAVLDNLKPDSPIGRISFFFSDDGMDDLWLVLTWGGDA